MIPQSASGTLFQSLGDRFFSFGHCIPEVHALYDSDNILSIL